MGDKRGWVWMSRKIIDKRFFLKILDYQDSDATIKVNNFHLKIHLRVFFWRQVMMEEIKLVLVEENRFEKGAK